LCDEAGWNISDDEGETMTARTDDEGGSGGQGWRIALWGGAAALMLTPAVAARLSDQMAWDSGDFILVGAILLAGCGLGELVMRKTSSWAYRGGAAIAVAAAFLLFLAAGAVGIIGSEDEPANLLYLGVIALGLAGAVLARFRPRGMARALAVTAGAHVLAGVIAIVLVPDVRGFLFATGLFTPLWLLSAWLFAKADRDEAA
jgi:hypothetical protein